MAYIYRHIKPNGETFYIGIGKNEKRLYSKHNRNKFWHNVVDKYGYEYQILKNNLNWQDACELEIILISYYGRRDLGLGKLVNLTNGGEGVLGLKGNIGNTGKKHSSETKNKISRTKLGCTPWNKNKKGISDETRIKMRNKKVGIIPWNKGIPATKERKYKQSILLKGKNNRNDNMIINLENGIYYNTIQEAADSLGINRNTLTGYLLGYKPNKSPFVYV